MRRFDKRKNILLANQKLEESYLNSKKLIKEIIDMQVNDEIVDEIKLDCNTTTYSIESLGDLKDKLLEKEFLNKNEEDLKNQLIELLNSSNDSLNKQGNDEDIGNLIYHKLAANFCK
jgi:hypothetical protein